MKCDIIKDLMPGYIDGLLSEAGSDAVREHLEDCEACKHVYMQMKEEIILQGEGRQGENIFVEQAALDGLRKVNSRTKRLRTVALLGGLLAAMIVIGIFLKVYVIGSLLDAHIVRVTDFQYDEQTDNLMLSGELILLWSVLHVLNGRKILALMDGLTCLSTRQKPFLMDRKRKNFLSQFLI